MSGHVAGYVGGVPTRLSSSSAGWEKAVNLQVPSLPYLQEKVIVGKIWEGRRHRRMPHWMVRDPWEVITLWLPGYPVL